MFQFWLVSILKQKLDSPVQLLVFCITSSLSTAHCNTTGRSATSTASYTAKWQHILASSPGSPIFSTHSRKDGEPVSCRVASPVESCPGDVNYTSVGTPSINDICPARRDNVLPRLRRAASAPQRKRRQRPAEVTCTNDRRYCGIYAIAFAVHAALGDDVNGEAPRIRPNSNEKSPLAVFQEKRACVVGPTIS